jgi:hypothetical protein
VGGEWFEGIPYSALPIDSVDWTHRADHVRERTIRYGATEFNLEPEWATEAALDENRLVGQGSSATSVEVVGLSVSAPPRGPADPGRVVKVWLVPKDHPPKGDWWGATACEGNARDRRDYWEEAQPHD